MVDFFNSLLDGIRESFYGVGQGVVEFLPKLIIAVIIFVIGWVVGRLLGQVVAQIVKSAKIDQLLRGAKVDEVLKRGGINLDSGKFLGELAEWFIVVVFLVASFDVL